MTFIRGDRWDWASFEDFTGQEQGKVLEVQVIRGLAPFLKWAQQHLRIAPPKRPDEKRVDSLMRAVGEGKPK